MARVHFPKLPPKEAENVDEWMDRRGRAFQQREVRRKAEKWMTVDVPELQGRPFGVAMLGDMHGDDKDCNLPLLRADLAAIANTGGMYGVHLGDATNNWVGRLMSIYAEQGSTEDEARRFCEWALHDSGVEWLCWLGGNHDKWREGLAILGLIAGPAWYIPFWEARLVLRAGRSTFRVHLKHDFKGHSDWNPTHGPLKAAFKESDADLLVCGHRHIWGTQSFEVGGNGRVAHVARARGYKWADSFALEKGFTGTEHGAGVVAIFDPSATDPASRIILIPNVQKGCAMLAAMRKAAEKRDAPQAPRKPKAKKPAAKAAKKAKPKRKTKRA
jgi:predicted phosphodiesterase